MTLRKRIFVVIGIVAAVILLVILFWYLGRKKAAQKTASIAPTPVAEQPATTAPSVVAPTSPVSPFPPGNPEDVYLKQLARLFVERYGSYSNQNGNGQITDVLPLATDRMKQYLLGKQQGFSMEYRGATTHVVTSRLDKKDATSAVVHVDVQRIVSDSSGSKTVYDSGTVQLTKEGNVWKVDGLFWGK